MRKGPLECSQYRLENRKKGLCGRDPPFVAEVEIRELDFAYAVGVMLVPRSRTDQALVYILSL